MSRGGAFQKFQLLLKKFDLNQSVSRTQLKRNYLAKVKLWHPDVNPSQSAKRNFLQLQDDYHELEKLMNNSQFMSEWKQFKAGQRESSYLDQDSGLAHPFTQKAWGTTPGNRETPFRDSNGGAWNGSKKEKYYYYHSSPFNRPEARNVEDDEFERFRRYQESQRRTPEARFWRHPLFGPSPFALIFLCFFPYFLVSTILKRRMEGSGQMVDERQILSREIKTQIWGELRKSNFSDTPLSPPSSTVLMAIDSEAIELDKLLQRKPTVDKVANVSGTSTDSSAAVIPDATSVAKKVRINPWDNLIESAHHGNRSDTAENATPKKGSKKKLVRDATNPYYHSRSERGNQLHRAVIYQDPHRCAELLLRGAYASTGDRKHRTPLHYAAFSGQLDVCRLLLLFNANPLAMDGFQETPIDAARQAGWKDVETLLVFAASGSYKLAKRLADAPDSNLSYGAVFAQSVAASLGAYIPEDLMGRLGRFV